MKKKMAKWMILAPVAVEDFAENRFSWWEQQWNRELIQQILRESEEKEVESQLQNAKALLLNLLDCQNLSVEKKLFIINHFLKAKRFEKDAEKRSQLFWTMQNIEGRARGGRGRGSIDQGISFLIRLSQKIFRWILHFA